MSAEFPASQARDITDNSEEWSAELWYMKFKDSLFLNIQIAALNGINFITVDSSEWSVNSTKKEYLRSRLTALGYKVDTSDNETMKVIW
jgi:hypothetical protein